MSDEENLKKSEQPEVPTTSTRSNTTSTRSRLIVELTDKPKQWLIDRSEGNSHIMEEELGRPPCPLCWPPPCVKYCPDVFEMNACCEFFGKLGCFGESEPLSRIWLMRKSLLVHFAGLIMSILACTAITSQPDLLSRFPFSSGRVTGFVGDIEIQEVFMKVGLTTILVQDNYFGERTNELNDLCAGTSLGIPLTSQKDCNTCKDASAGLVTTVIMGVITYIPTIASNVNRSYYNYDVNCQKVFGTVIAFFSMLMSLYTWQGYSNSCFATFYEGEVVVPVLVPKDFNGTNIGDDRPFLELMQTLNATWLEENLGTDPDNLDFEGAFEALGLNETLFAGRATEIRIARVLFDWQPGMGLLLIVIATILKLVDIINHLLVRTPRITRNLEEQKEYEKLYGPIPEGEEDDEEEVANVEAGDNKDGGDKTEDATKDSENQDGDKKEAHRGPNVDV